MVFDEAEFAVNRATLSIPKAPPVLALSKAACANTFAEFA
jgi:hypothetical protein